MSSTKRDSIRSAPDFAALMAKFSKNKSSRPVTPEQYRERERQTKDLEKQQTMEARKATHSYRLSLGSLSFTVPKSIRDMARRERDMLTEAKLNAAKFRGYAFADKNPSNMKRRTSGNPKFDPEPTTMPVPASESRAQLDDSSIHAQVSDDEGGETWSDLIPSQVSSIFQTVWHRCTSNPGGSVHARDQTPAGTTVDSLGEGREGEGEEGSPNDEAEQGSRNDDERSSAHPSSASNTGYDSDDEGRGSDGASSSSVSEVSYTRYRDDESVSVHSEEASPIEEHVARPPVSEDESEEEEDDEDDDSASIGTPRVVSIWRQSLRRLSPSDTDPQCDPKIVEGKREIVSGFNLVSRMESGAVALSGDEGDEDSSSDVGPGYEESSSDVEGEGERNCSVVDDEDEGSSDVDHGYEETSSDVGQEGEEQEVQETDGSPLVNDADEDWRASPIDEQQTRWPSDSVSEDGYVTDTDEYDSDGDSTTTPSEAGVLQYKLSHRSLGRALADDLDQGVVEGKQLITLGFKMANLDR